DKRVTQVEAAGILDLCDRQIRRIAERIVQEGDKGVVHRSRGQPSHNAINPKIKKRAIDLCKDVYDGFGPTLASEKLFERDKIRINRETLRQWLKEEQLPYRDRKKRPYRHWRERKECYGQMIQMDGFEHDWFEGRGPECVFMGYIDDATGRPFGRFYAYEGTIPAMDSFKRYIKKRGIPVSVYLDKHSTYKSTRKPTIEEELANQEALSQFERALKELGVDVIHANSPQAKGRIERLFNTFQDRLIKEMRLANIRAIDQANAFLGRYLPVYAKRFAVKPSKNDDLHRPIPKGMDLDRMLCIRTKRVLRNDFTVAHDKKLYQILDNVRAKEVMVEERLDGSMAIRHKDTKLKFKEITTRPKKPEPKKTHEFKLRRPYIQPAEHLWRRSYKFNPHINSYSQREKGSQKEKELLLVKT
ncbi:MAG: ISNCY family transposase, partial [Candidatus Omnitrophota bacterium]